MMKSKYKLLEALINGAEIFGLGESDIEAAKGFLEYNEPGLSFDTIVTQLYEYEIKINSEYYMLISKIAIILKLPLEEYDYTKQLIGDENNIPKYVKEQLSTIFTGLD